MLDPQQNNVDTAGYVQLTRALTNEEDCFALGVIEYAGNLQLAYVAAFGAGAPNPTARARELMARPEITARIRELNGTVQQASLISLESHMVELAVIRDIAKNIGSLKVALNAEELRGKVAGLYIGKADINPTSVQQIDHLEQLAGRLVSLQRKYSKEVVDVETKTPQAEYA